MDNISIMCRNSLLCCFLTWIVSRPGSESESERQRARNEVSKSERDFSRDRATIHTSESKWANLQQHVIFFSFYNATKTNARSRRPSDGPTLFFKQLGQVANYCTLRQHFRFSRIAESPRKRSHIIHCYNFWCMPNWGCNCTPCSNVEPPLGPTLSIADAATDKIWPNIKKNNL